jgi:hypothetical protein
LEKVSSQKNTFELHGALGPITGVDVFDLSDPNDNPLNLVWGIRSTRWVSGMAEFRITVPEIPKGFVQVIPTPPEQFELRTGKLYKIDVYYRSGPTCPAHCQWAAE